MSILPSAINRSTVSSSPAKHPFTIIPPPYQPLVWHSAPIAERQNQNPHLTACLEVRHDVFVVEQRIAKENEIDDDDQRSWHCIVYASSASNGDSSSSSGYTTTVNNSTVSAPDTLFPSEPAPPTTSTSLPAAAKTPIATLRIVPPPHADEHTYQGKSIPYIKLGRLAICAGYRGQQTARSIVQGALDWAGNNKAVIREECKRQQGQVAVNDASSGDGWDGLVLVHAQVRVERFWAKMGFVTDKEMGTWDEEGIMHLGMWRWV